MPAAMRFIATTTLGTEGVLIEELEDLGIEGASGSRGAVVFEGELADGYRACLWSRVASRVLLELCAIPARDAEELYASVREVPWSDHLARTGTMAVDFVGTSASIRNSKFGALKVKDAVVDSLRDASGERPSVDLRSPDVRIFCRLVGGEATLSIDLSGAPLFQRGHRRDGGPAPLKETLAAAILRMANWPEASALGAALIDPMCGSGTFLTEAAGMAVGVAPGLSRSRWGFEGWQGHEAETWAREVDRARNALLRDMPSIRGRDQDAAQVARATENIARAGLSGSIRVDQGKLADARPLDGEVGLLVTNPPYGERLEGAVVETYREVGDVMRRHFLGWTGWVLAGSPKLARQTGLKPNQKIPLWNGRIECRLIELQISDRAVSRDA